MKELPYPSKKVFFKHLENSLLEIHKGLSILEGCVKDDQPLWIARRVKNDVDSLMLFLDQSRANIPG